MKRTRISLSLLVALALATASSAAMAQAPSPAGKAIAGKQDDCAKARARGKACEIEFKEGEDVEGGVPTGEGETVTARVAIPFSNLIRLRLNFRDAILKTADALP